MGLLHNRHLHRAIRGLLACLRHFNYAPGSPRFIACADPLAAHRDARAGVCDRPVHAQRLAQSIDPLEDVYRIIGSSPERHAQLGRVLINAQMSGLEA